MTNLLTAIKNIISNPSLNSSYLAKSNNRVNSVGEAFEIYIKDAFCDSFYGFNDDQKNEIYAKNFSYIGNQNNPPDLIIKGGDAIEIKKIENSSSAIALNSSYPKSKIYASSPMITKACRDCEDWKEKDILYAIGSVSKGSLLKSIWLVYGDCLAADKEIYEKVKEKISDGLHELPSLEIAETNELGRVNKIDPLGITYLRIRGMWHIENPNRIFGYLTKNSDDEFVLNALLLKEKYGLFPLVDRLFLEDRGNKNLSISEVKIKSPNNPAKLLDAKLISFKR